MENNENIFRAYDIRGIYNEELNPETVARIGMALGSYLGGEGRVCLGRDGRTSSEAIERALVSGLVSTGIDVELIGLLPIPLANYWTWKKELSAGIYITASHNPAQYNGIRFRHPDGTGYTIENEAIKDIFLEGDFILSEWDKLGNVYHIDTNALIDEYIEYIIQHWSGEDKKLKIVVDSGNGVATTVVPKLLARLGMDVLTLNSQVDGTFPGRPSEPSRANIAELCTFVRKCGVDLGMAFDGDSDRCVFVNEGGNMIQVEKIAVLLGRELLKEHDGNIISTVSGSMIVNEEIERAGGTVVTVRVGDVFVAEAIKEHGAIFAAEDSAHFFLPLDYYFDDPILTAMFLLEILTHSGESLGEIMAQIPSYPKEKEGFDCSDDIKFKVIEKIVKHYEDKEGDFQLLTIDGAKIIYEDGWGLIRCSNTQPKVRITVEARNEERVEELQEEFRNIFLEKQEEVSGARQ